MVASVLFDVFALAQRTRSLLDVALAGAPLTPAQYALYSAVFDSGPLSTSDLARVVGMPVTSVHDEVTAMAARGHVERRTDVRDRRAVLLRLTREGRAVHRATGRSFEVAIAAVERRLDRPLPDVRDALAALGRACDAAAADVAYDAQGSAG
jgi:DNA-binding MarR family transcriptional regulator